MVPEDLKLKSAQIGATRGSIGGEVRGNDDGLYELKGI